MGTCGEKNPKSARTDAWGPKAGSDSETGTARGQQPTVSHIIKPKLTHNAKEERRDNFRVPQHEGNDGHKKHN